MILFLRFRRATLLLTRGMGGSLRHQQPLEASFVGMRHERGFTQAPLPLGVLPREQVALVRAMAAQPARPGQPDALPEGAFGFLFGHMILPGLALGVSCSSAIWGPAPSTCCGPRASGAARSWPRLSAPVRPDRALRVPGRCAPSAGPDTSSSLSPCCRPARTHAHGAS